ncbi:DNA polymerase III subunit delta [Fructilactobacillus florum]|nr:DNA polymerase III subunit delta [Fructilactobacillus florum]
MNIEQGKPADLKQSGKENQMTISQQVAKITSQQKSIYLVIGQNEFWESRILERLQQLIPITEQTMNFASYDLEATSLGTALNDARSLPFFGNHRIVVIKNAAFLTGQAKSTASPAEISDLLKYLQQPVAETTLVIFAPYEKLDSRKKITKELKKQAEIIDFNQLSEREIRDFIKKYVKNKHYQIEPAALEELISRTQADLTMTMNELQKVFLYCYQQPNITVAVVDQVVSKSLDQNVFSLVNYLLRGETTQAISFYHELIEEGQEAIKLNAILEGQFRLLLQVSILSRQGRRQTEMATILKVHPYRVKLALKNEQQFTLQELRTAYLNLIEIECQLKSSSSNPELLFENFALQHSKKKNPQ